MTGSAHLRPRVLVVAAPGDEADSLRALVTVWGCDVRTAASGAAALAEVEAFRPQLALVDLRLRDPDGNELARHIRLLPDGGAVTLVALAGHAARAEGGPARTDGFDHFLTLPVDPEMLRRLVGG